MSSRAAESSSNMQITKDFKINARMASQSLANRIASGISLGRFPMRIFSLLLIAALVLHLPAQAQTATPCTGLCMQQVSCTGNATTSITGIVYAPNGTDPLPNVTVYIPNAPVDPFTPGVSCPVVGAPPSGSPLVGTTSAVDGSFTLVNVPVGTNIPLVIVSGRWRRQLVIPTTTTCTNTALPSATFASSGTMPFAAFPQNQTQGDIPRIAIATGAVDQVECILRKVGVADTEFTDAGSVNPGRINLFTGSGGPGSSIDTATPTQATLMENSATLNQYDVLMLPCQGTPNNNVVAGSLGTQELASFINFANSGGRVYSSHYSYAWMYNNPPFNGVANWLGSSGGGSETPDPGIATVNQGFTAGQTLAQWLELTGASSTVGQMPISTLKHDINGVIAPTQSWLTLNTTGNPVMQMVFDTPIAPTGTTVNQCGRVLYNEYHVEAGSSSPTQKFPNECSATTTLNPQEKLLEYMLFELTDDGGQPSLSPTSAAFGSEAVGFTTAAQSFTWTNNSSFTSQVSSATITSDFFIASNSCASVPPGTSCTINVVYTPSVLGPETGTLTVTSSGNSLTAALTGTGVPGLSFSTTALTFGNLDVGNSASQTVTVTSVATSPLPMPPLLITGQYAVINGCGTTVAPLGTCTLTVVFSPKSTGPQTGTLSVNSSALVYSGLTVALTGNGVDFTLALSPTSGSVIAGDGPMPTPTATLTPIAGFSAPVTLNCAASVSGSTCIPATSSVTLSATTTSAINISTTSQYTVIGYGGFGGHNLLWIGIATGSGLLLLFARRRSPFVRSTLTILFLGVAAISLSSCSGKLPAKNAVYTAPGTYNVTLSATDGFLTHSVNYTLTVSAH
jgi:hypothetical protein